MFDALESVCPMIVATALRSPMKVLRKRVESRLFGSIVEVIFARHDAVVQGVLVGVKVDRLLVSGRVGSRNDYLAPPVLVLFNVVARLCQERLAERLHANLAGVHPFRDQIVPDRFGGARPSPGCP